MTPDFTLAVTKTCPKDGVHLSHPAMPRQPQPLAARRSHPSTRQDNQLTFLSEQADIK